MGLIPIQEIHIRTNTGKLYQLDLKAESDWTNKPIPPYTIEIIFPDADPSKGVRQLYAFNVAHTDPAEAFADGLRWVKNHSERKNQTLAIINNPNNCEFLSKADQAVIIDRFGITVSHQVNGI